jgi:hypothetical protein
MDPQAMENSYQEPSQSLYNDVNSLLINVLLVVYSLKRRPLIIDFMNYVRRFKLDTRGSLYNSIETVIEKIEYNRERKYHNGFNTGCTKIIVHKNPEGVELNEQDITDMKQITSEDHSIIIMYAVYCGISKNKDESFTAMKKRYKREDKPAYSMYSRDDCVLNTLYYWLENSMCSPVLFSNDEFKDIGVYKYMPSFQTYMIVKGQSYEFIFDYSSINHNDLFQLVRWIQENPTQY